MAVDAVEFIIRARDEATSVINRAQGGIGNLTGAISQLGGKASVFGLVAGGIAGVTGAIIALGNSIRETVEHFELLSEETGVSFEQLQILTKVTELHHRSAEDLTSALVFLNRQIAQGDPLLKQLGVDTSSTGKAFMDIVTILANSNDQFKKSEVSFRLLGRGSKDLIGIFKVFRDETEEIGAAMDRTGTKITDKVIPGALELDHSFDQLKEQFKGVMTQLQISVIPMAQKMVDWFSRMMDTVLLLERAWERLNNTMAKFKLPGMKGPGGGVGKNPLVSKGGAPVAGQVLTETDPDLYAIEVAAKKALDPLRNIRLEEVKLTAEQKRRLELLELIGPKLQLVGNEWGEVGRKIGLTNRFANEFIDALFRIEKQRENTKKLGEAFETVFGPSAKDFFDTQIPEPRKVGAEKAGPLPLPSIEDLKLVDVYTAKMHELVDSFGEIDEGVVDVRMEWTELAEKMTSDAALLDGVLSGLWLGLESSFTAAASQITARWKYSANLLNNITHAVVDEMIAQFARLAAAEIFSTIMNFLNPGGGGSFSWMQGGWESITNPNRAGRPRAEGNVSINVTALDAASVYDSLTAPNGALRLAFENAAMRSR